MDSTGSSTTTLVAIPSTPPKLRPLPAPTIITARDSLTRPTGGTGEGSNSSSPSSSFHLQQQQQQQNKQENQQQQQNQQHLRGRRDQSRRGSWGIFNINIFQNQQSSSSTNSPSSSTTTSTTTTTPNPLHPGSGPNPRGRSSKRSNSATRKGVPRRTGSSDTAVAAEVEAVEPGDGVAGGGNNGDIGGIFAIRGMGISTRSSSLNRIMAALGGGGRVGGGYGKGGDVIGKVGLFGTKSAARKEVEAITAKYFAGKSPPRISKSSSPTKAAIAGEDDERNQRHAEVVALLNRRKRLSEAFEAEYELGEVLGDGAFGFVFTATRKSVNVEVAVKFIVRDKIPLDLLTPDPKNPGREIPSEINLLLKLHHPGIIAYIDHFHEESHILLVTELHGTQWDVQRNQVLSPSNNPGLRMVNKGLPSPAEDRGECSPLFRLTEAQEKEVRRRTSCDLFECIDKRIPESTARTIFAQVALVVNYLNENNIVHKDLKDENIVIDENYRIKIVDFGSAAAIPLRIDDYFKKFNGTAHFASPEVSSGAPFRGPEAEIWSLGVLLFTIVFGENPFHTREEIIRGDIRYPFTVYGETQNIESKCCSLIQRLLAYDPHRRIRIEEVLTHPWLRDEVERLRSLNEGW